MQTIVPGPTPTSRRRSLRRAVSMTANVGAEAWDGLVPFVATNLSPSGMWVDSDLSLDVGSEVVVSFVPPRWPDASPITALAEVARVGLFRRQREQGRPGMGLRFLEIDDDRLELLNHALRGLPPPLPSRRLRARSIEVERPSIDESIFPQIVLDDGSRFQLRAEGELLTAGRGPELVRAPIAAVVPITSAMSAILARRSHASRLAS